MTLSMHVLLFVVLLTEGALGIHRRVCRSQVNDMKRTLRQNIYDRRIAHTLRLFFHDCVGETCDGCFNFDHPFNTGVWAGTVRLLNQIYQDNNFDRYISYADYYTLAAIVAIEEGVKNANRDAPHGKRVPVPRIRFQYGRQDCPTAPIGTVSQPLPSANLDNAGVFGFFRDMFGFDTEKTVAIMGGHTLGGATGRVNGAGSGWLGFWKENEFEGHKFDNRYYSMLVNKDLTWEHLDKANETGFFLPRWQWEGFDSEGNLDSFMLNADMAIFLKVQPDADGESACDFDTCQRDADGLSVVEEYAACYRDWLDDFEDAFLKMSSHGIRRRLRNPRHC